MEKWFRLKHHPMLPEGENGMPATCSKKHAELSREVAEEGLVLLKNNNNILPLKKGTRVALFGRAGVQYLKGGWGSGNVRVDYVYNLTDSLLEKQEEGFLSLYDPVRKHYAERVERYPGFLDWEELIPGPDKEYEVEISNDLVAQAATECDVAILFFSRASGENSDRFTEPGDGDFYLSPNEEKLVKAVTEKFEHSIVILNTCSLMDMTWCADNDKIEGILQAWNGGAYGALAIGDLLCGKICPSGKLTDTIAYTYDDYPSSESYNLDADEAEYWEDIFVGYRYFETIPGAAEKVAYPFGFGLSYTNFTSTYEAEEKDGIIIVKATVKNIGDMSGKEVIQVYATAPKGEIDKPAVELRGYAKTKLLAPEEECILTITFKVDEMASYDEARAAYVLESGDYIITAGNNIRNREQVLIYNLHETRITQQLTNYCKPHKLSKRLTSNGEYIACETEENPPKPDISEWSKNKPKNLVENSNYLVAAGFYRDPYWKENFADLLGHDIRTDMRTQGSYEGRYILKQVANGEVSMEDFMAQLSLTDLITLVGGTFAAGCAAKCSGVGNLPYFDIPAAQCADGPAGLRIQDYPTTAFPSSTMQACTWNLDLITRVGEAGAKEVKEHNLAVWLAPSMNIHRNPKCGRNFEYYSEDPLVSGRSAVAFVNGCQSLGIATSIKHLCCNNKELNRYEMDSILSERALREIYLKGFEIAVKEANPWTIMTCYNRVNGWFLTENRDVLTGIIREEWGYDGLIISDWGCRGEPFLEMLAGNNVHMPFSNPDHLCHALQEGYITREDLERNVRYLLEFLIKLP